MPLHKKILFWIINVNHVTISCLGYVLKRKTIQERLCKEMWGILKLESSSWGNIAHTCGKEATSTICSQSVNAQQIPHLSVWCSNPDVQYCTVTLCHPPLLLISPTHNSVLGSGPDGEILEGLLQQTCCHVTYGDKLWLIGRLLVL